MREAHLSSISLRYPIISNYFSALHDELHNDNRDTGGKYRNPGNSDKSRSDYDSVSRACYQRNALNPEYC